MNDNPLEKVIEKKICDHAKSLGYYVRKFTSPAHRSVPDRLLIAPNGVVFFFEVKRRGEVPTLAQSIEIGKITKQGVQVFVVDNVETGKRILEEMLTKPKQNR